MLVLQANQEQENTFNKLIQTMGEQVVWNGRFIIKDDELILEGAVRSLIFQFDTKKVLTDLIDIPVREEQILDISRHPTLKDLINMVLYAFGKWGTLRGLRVQQDYSQLNELFGKILGTFYIEPSFRKENFRFYKVGVRVTYEEVLQTVLEYERKQAEDPRAESQGLWHRLIWKKQERAFQKTETTLQERVEDRIGNNFYLVGYQCPKCSEKLHMAVYPDGKEVRIDTEEKGVYLARVYTCSRCHSFYTPRPGRLISEGLIYEMNFGDDEKAYEDYLELMGYYGERAANYKYNEYEAIRNQRLQREATGNAGSSKNPDQLDSPQDALRQIEDFSKNFAGLPNEVFKRFAHRVEEGFYPDAAVAKHEKKILQEVREREEKEELQKNGALQKNEALQKTQGKQDTAADPHTGTGFSENSSRKEYPEHTKWSRDSLENMALDDMGQVRYPENLALDDMGQVQYPENMALDDMGQVQYSGSTALDDSGQVQYSGSMVLDDSGQVRHAARSDHKQARYQAGYDAGVMQAGRSETADRQPGHTANQTSAPNRSQTGGSNQIPLTDHLRADSLSETDQAGQNTAANQDAKQDSTKAAANQDAKQDSIKAAAKPGPGEEKLERYQKRVSMLDRLSGRQKQELKKQLQNDTEIDGSEKKYLLGQIEEAEFQEKSDALLKKAQQSVNKSYAQLQRMILETEKEDYPQELKDPFLEKLRHLRTRRAAEEVRQIMEKVPDRLDRAGYRKLEERLNSYEGADLSPYKEILQQKREAAEKNEIAGMVKRSRKISRGDYVSLMRRLEEQDFADENIAPYMDKIQEKVHTMDEERLEELLDQAQQMDFNAAAAVYEQIDGENFLPELKNSALEMLAKRLEKIRTDECELLVKKLQEEMRNSIRENARHHFYPARKVMLNTAEPGETSAIDAALAAYASDRSMFEYPIFSVDTSRSCNGREGMVLTPENLFYSTRMHAYKIPVSDIASIGASTGLLNRRIALEETNGAEHKLPYAVKTGEMEDWAGILEDFVHYLQEKPASRKLRYLAKETHDTICCYRCGYVYHGRDVCPECGYKKNR